MSSTAAISRGPLSIVLEYYGAPRTSEAIVLTKDIGQTSTQAFVRFIYANVLKEFEILIDLGRTYALEETASKLIRDFARRKFHFSFDQGGYFGGLKHFNLNLCADCTEVAKRVLSQGGDNSLSFALRVYEKLHVQGLVTKISNNGQQVPALLPFAENQGPVEELAEADMSYEARGLIRRAKRPRSPPAPEEAGAPSGEPDLKKRKQA